ncbi:hypothetical protein BSP18_125 [Bacillus phage BSP18]|nr:hypothetical protein BSP18_125 [Bacillus phage BSP18]
MAYNDMNGKLTDPKVSDYIRLLQDHMEVYGDTRVRAYFEDELDDIYDGWDERAWDCPG